MIERFLVPGQFPPVSHYCHVVRAGNQIWVSGAVGVREDGSIPASTVEQFRLALASVDVCLKHAGAGAANVVKVNVYMTDITERAAINPIRQAYFGEHLPASTLVEVKGLVDPQMKVEIEAIAILNG
ncbi:MAG: RidA family protein [Betaproteobacteria bacterium]|nr:RidA family protein [Betaproteobacteria bacterium]